MSEERLSLAEFRGALLELCGRAVPMSEGGDAPENGIPTAALVIVEWQGDDGHRWLSCVATLGSGEDAPNWTARMLAYEALNWDGAEEDE